MSRNPYPDYHERMTAADWAAIAGHSEALRQRAARLEGATPRRPVAEPLTPEGASRQADRLASTAPHSTGDPGDGRRGRRRTA